MTAQFFFIQEIASNDVLSNIYIPFFHEKSLKGENSIFLEKLFQYRNVSSIFEKSVTHFIGWLTDPFKKKNDGGGVVGVVGVNQHFGETTFSVIIVIFVVYVTVYVTNKSQKAIFVDVKENYLLMINYENVILAISNNGQHRFLSFVILQMEISFSFEIVGNWIMFWCLVLYLDNDGFKYKQFRYNNKNLPKLIYLK